MPFEDDHQVVSLIETLFPPHSNKVVREKTSGGGLLGADAPIPRKLIPLLRRRTA